MGEGYCGEEVIRIATNSITASAIASLRKHIERNSKTKEIKQRDILIFKLLRELEKDGFKRNKKIKRLRYCLKNYLIKTSQLPGTILLQN